MPYTIRKRKCKKSAGGSGSYVLSYTDKKGKKHNNCHSSRKGAQGQIAAIEAEGIQHEEQNTMKLKLSELRRIIRSVIQESIHEEVDEQDLKEDEFTYAIAKAAIKGEKEVDIDGEKFPVKMSKEKAKDIVGKQQK
jgi:hypothetical protein